MWFDIPREELILQAIAENNGFNFKRNCLFFMGFVYDNQQYDYNNHQTFSDTAFLAQLKEYCKTEIDRLDEIAACEERCRQKQYPAHVRNIQLKMEKINELMVEINAEIEQLRLK